MTKRKPSMANLPEFLRITDAQREVSDRIQAQVQQAMRGRVQASRQEARLIRGLQGEESARATLEVLFSERRRKGRAEAIKAQLARLADSYADQGRYAEAADTHPDTKRAKQYREIHDAIERPDDEGCNCQSEDARDPTSGKTLRIPLENAIEEVFSHKHNRIMPLIRCNKCGKLNVKPLPEVLARRTAALASTEQPTEKTSDLSLLK
jgi:hypothetical protein